MKLFKNLLFLVTGAILTLIVLKGFSPDLSIENRSTDEDQPKSNAPLYWVAPMDPDYKRDKPGKSPMGMDLVPVYSESISAVENEPGTVTISPDVVNNLGVRTTQVVMRTLDSNIKTVGYVQYDEDKLIHIHPRVEGWVEKLYVKASGDPVKQGQALYSIYSPALVNAQEEYLIALQRKNNRLIEAAEARLKTLKIPQQFITNIRKTGQVKQLVPFYAPQSGVITKLNIREGFFVKPDTSMMSIGVLDEVWVEAEIFERQASQITVGQPVTMTSDYVPGREWLGHVDYIYPDLNATTRTLRVRLRFSNQDKALIPNMFTQISIHTRSRQALVVPREAVVRTGEMDRVVVALGEGKFKSIAVEIGRSDNDFVEILDGVYQGETIVSSAQFLIDSESSKTSDFKRLSHMVSAVEQATVHATIHFIREPQRLINVTHQPITEWNRPEMTMNLAVDEAVDLAQFSSDMVVIIEIIKDEMGHLMVRSIKPLEHHQMQGMAMPAVEAEE